VQHIKNVKHFEKKDKHFEGKCKKEDKAAPPSCLSLSIISVLSF
jgi:hypothetical protein